MGRKDSKEKPGSPEGRGLPGTAWPFLAMSHCLAAVCMSTCQLHSGRQGPRHLPLMGLSPNLPPPAVSLKSTHRCTGEWDHCRTSRVESPPCASYQRPVTSQVAWASSQHGRLGEPELLRGWHRLLAARSSQGHSLWMSLRSRKCPCATCWLKPYTPHQAQKRSASMGAVSQSPVTLFGYGLLTLAPVQTSCASLQPSTARGRKLGGRGLCVQFLGKSRSQLWNHGQKKSRLCF